jgi:hypothetical protein
MNYEELSMQGDELRSESVTITFIDDSRSNYKTTEFAVNINEIGMVIVRSKLDGSILLYPQHAYKKIRINKVKSNLTTKGAHSG